MRRMRESKIWAVQRMANHLVDQTGALGEEMPRVVKLWEQLIEYETSVESNS